MKIDRARAQKAFADYAAHYNAADAKVKLKIDHTYRVAALCARIAQSLAPVSYTHLTLPTTPYV